MYAAAYYRDQQSPSTSVSAGMIHACLENRQRECLICLYLHTCVLYISYTCVSMWRVERDVTDLDLGRLTARRKVFAQIQWLCRGSPYTEPCPAAPTAQDNDEAEFIVLGTPSRRFARQWLVVRIQNGRAWDSGGKRIWPRVGR